MATFICEIGPSPLDRPGVLVSAGGNEQEIKPDPAGQPLAYVWKTLADPYVGKVSMLKVLSGTIRPDAVLSNPRSHSDEKLHGLFTMRGKEHDQLSEVPAGDLVEGWQRLLGQLPPKVKGLFREARPDREGSKLVLWFRYGFHHQNAQEHVGDVQPLVQGWLGEGVSLEFRLSEAGDEGPTARPPAPEEHPFVQAAVRKLEGKVTRVREISR